MVYLKDGKPESSGRLRGFWIPDDQDRFEFELRMGGILWRGKYRTSTRKATCHKIYVDPEPGTPRDPRVPVKIELEHWQHAF